jgi:DNA-binding phage protein
MRKYRKWREIVIEQLAADWDAALDYIQFAMTEYQVDGDTAVFLLSLRTFIESQGGVAELENKTGIEAQTLLEVLTSDDAPCIDTLRIIFNALGCRLSIEQLDKTGDSLELAGAETIRANTVLEQRSKQLAKSDPS